MNRSNRLEISTLAFMFLFAAEFTFYLLILQTGVVMYHASELTQIWMMPVGGMLGVFVSVFVYRARGWLIPLLLFLQLLLSFHYATANTVELFLLGLLSGLTAPVLIARITGVGAAAIALAISYAYGTSYFSVPAAERTDIALFLSAVALFASLFAKLDRDRTAKGSVSVYCAGTIFFWLLLDAALFETLSRDSDMQLWGNISFTGNIIIFHCIGLFAAYKARDWRYNDGMILLLFALTYSLYATGLREPLSLVYPFTISYYNVIILRQLMRLPYALLAMIALSLWAASGMGLLVALSGSLVPAWGALVVLGLLYIARLSSLSPSKVLCFLRMIPEAKSMS